MIHTAATVSLRLERRDAMWRSNVLGTSNAIEAARRAGARRFVHFSSVTVFGLEFPDGVDEGYPVRNTFIPYPDSKIASEQVVLQAAPRREGRSARWCAPVTCTARARGRGRSFPPS